MATSNKQFPQWAIHLFMIGAFAALMFLYFSPILQGKVIYQGDIVQNRGMAKELNDFRDATGKEALWTDAMFGGMPTFQISTVYPGNLFASIEKILTLGLSSPLKQIFMMFMCFYLLLCVCRVRPTLSAVGAFAFAFSSYFFIILEAGHNTKAMVSAYIPAIIAGTILAYRGKYGWGAAITLLALALQINANHLQITYYMGIILLGIAIAAILEVIHAISEVKYFITTNEKKIRKINILAFFSLEILTAIIYYFLMEYYETSIIEKELFLKWAYRMTYIMLGVFTISLTIESMAKNSSQNFFDNIDMSRFVKASLILIFSAGLAVLPNVSRLWTTYEYTEVTMRGKSELSSAESKTGGLDKEYAFRWSYGVGETFNIMVPNMYGGASGSPLSEKSACYEYLKTKFGDQTAKQVINQMPTYWGDQPFTSGPTYIGAAIVFLFIFAMVLAFMQKGNSHFLSATFAASMLGVTVLAIMLSWGRHFPALSHLFFDYLPLYNKFRAVAMILVIAQFMMPFLGFLAVGQVIDALQNEGNNAVKKGETPVLSLAANDILGALKISAGIALGIVAIILLGGYMIFDFVNPSEGGDAAVLAQMGFPKDAITGMVSALIDDRRSMLVMDALRGLLWIAAAAGAIWAFVNRKISANAMTIVLGLVMLIDFWTVNKRYLNDDNFKSKSEYQRILSQTTPADDAILKDKSHFRVLNMAVNTFNDALTSYHHKSVGGYHPAKLRRYQDMIEANIQPEMQTLGASLQKGATDSTIRLAFSKTPVLNMMDAKYIIYNKEAAPLPNPLACGNAWFVSEIKNAENADAELAALKAFNPKKTAIVGKEFEKEIAGFTASADSAATIKLTEYKPNHLTYESNSSKEGLAVFSEIYYAKGWKASIDGKEVPHFRADYVLRAMRIPAGKHTIVFSFEPESYITGEKYALMGSVLVLLLIAGAVFWEVRRKKA